MDWTATWLTLQLAAATSVILLIGGLPFAYWLARTRWWGRPVIVALVTMPLVLPPTVLGFFLLVALGPNSPIGRWLDSVWGVRIPFTFAGLLIASVIGNLPFAIRPFVAAFSSLDDRLVEAAWCLGASRTETFLRVSLPLCWPGILAGLVMTFAHSLGEFGVVLMIGGNIPGVTRTLSIAIYDDVQALNYQSAAVTAGGLVVVALILVTLLQIWGPRSSRSMSP